MIKLYFVFLLITFVAAVEYSIKFTEADREYIESVNINKYKNVVQYDVLTHAGIGNTQYFTDYNMNITVMRDDDTKMCYAMALTADEANITDLELGLQKMNGKFPEDKYWVKNVDFIPIGELEATLISQEIGEFCAPYLIVKAISATVDRIQEMALENAKQIKSGRSKRQSTKTIPDFFACNSTTIYDFESCNINKLQVMCKSFTQKKNMFKVLYSIDLNGLVCYSNVHVFTKLRCCNYICKT